MGSARDVIVRAERPEDRSAIRQVNAAAFGGREEADLVDALRAQGAVLVSLVAEVNRAVVGHVLFSRMSIDAPGRLIAAAALAPMAVLPACQRQGIGAKLIEEGLQAVRAIGERIVIVVGHPAYYPRFGFSSDKADSLDSNFTPGALMALDLTPGALDGVSGRLTYPAAFGIPEFPLRAGTNDDVIYNNVVRNNEYQLPKRFAPGAVVVDIGAHVGAFSFLALERGASSVHGFEPEPANFACAQSNLAPFADRVHLYNRAVWRSDVAPAALHFWPSSDQVNTGGGTLIWDTAGPLVDVVAFDEIVESVTDGGRRRIDLVKIDCEGAEFPILLTSTLLTRIDRIVGEYHELRADLPAHVRIPGCDRFTLDVLVTALQRAGFEVRSEKQATAQYGDLGLFFASRSTQSTQ